jgi:hypothetical protein
VRHAEPHLNRTEVWCGSLFWYGSVRVQQRDTFWKKQEQPIFEFNFFGTTYWVSGMKGLEPKMGTSAENTTLII